jgi:hypothetical protein
MSPQGAEAPDETAQPTRLRSHSLRARFLRCDGGAENGAAALVWCLSDARDGRTRPREESAVAVLLYEEAR